MPQKKRTKARPKDKTKSGHLSLRVHARTEFAVHFVAMLMRLSDTAAIEEAIDHWADARSKQAGFPWRRFWHPIEGVRWLRIYTIEGIPLDERDELRRAFVQEHMAFFYDVGNVEEPEPIVRNAEALWPRIDEYVELAKKNYWDAGRAMGDALRERGISPPAWSAETSAS